MLFELHLLPAWNGLTEVQELFEVGKHQTSYISRNVFKSTKLLSLIMTLQSMETGANGKSGVPAASLVGLESSIVTELATVL